MVSRRPQIACRRGHDDGHYQNTQSVWPFDITVLKYCELPSIMNSQMGSENAPEHRRSGITRAAKTGDRTFGDGAGGVVALTGFFEDC
jgi:hypothetical protein